MQAGGVDHLGRFGGAAGREGRDHALRHADIRAFQPPQGSTSVPLRMSRS